MTKRTPQTIKASVGGRSNSQLEHCASIQVRAVDRRRPVSTCIGNRLRNRAEHFLVAPAKLNEALLADDEAAAELGARNLATAEATF